MRIAGAGCSLVDFFYTNVDFGSDAFLKLRSRTRGDGGLEPGRLVFLDDFERYAGMPYRDAIRPLVGERAPDATNVGGPAVVPLILAAQLLRHRGFEVDYYGAATPLNQLASFHAADARMMLITPFDRNSIHSVEKAIRDSDLGVNPATDGNVVRVVLPQLTEERRREYIKVARHKAEEARVSIRNIRRQAKESLEKLKKDGEAGEDDVKRGLTHLEEITHEQVAHVDEILKHKEEELLEV